MPRGCCGGSGGQSNRQEGKGPRSTSPERGLLWLLCGCKRKKKRKNKSGGKLSARDSDDQTRDAWSAGQGSTDGMGGKSGKPHAPQNGTANKNPSNGSARNGIPAGNGIPAKSTQNNCRVPGVQQIEKCGASAPATETDSSQVDAMPERSSSNDSVDSRCQRQDVREHDTDAASTAATAVVDPASVSCSPSDDYDVVTSSQDQSQGSSSPEENKATVVDLRKQIVYFQRHGSQESIYDDLPPIDQIDIPVVPPPAHALQPSNKPYQSNVVDDMVSTGGYISTMAMRNGHRNMSFPEIQRNNIIASIETALSDISSSDSNLTQGKNPTTLNENEIQVKPWCLKSQKNKDNYIEINRACTRQSQQMESNASGSVMNDNEKLLLDDLLSSLCDSDIQRTHVKGGDYVTTYVQGVGTGCIVEQPKSAVISDKSRVTMDTDQAVLPVHTSSGICYKSPPSYDDQRCDVTQSPLRSSVVNTALWLHHKPMSSSSDVGTLHLPCLTGSTAPSSESTTLELDQTSSTSSDTVQDKGQDGDVVEDTCNGNMDGAGGIPLRRCTALDNDNLKEDSSEDNEKELDLPVTSQPQCDVNSNCHMGLLAPSERDNSSPRDHPSPVTSRDHTSPVTSSSGEQDSDKQIKSVLQRSSHAGRALHRPAKSAKKKNVHFAEDVTNSDCTSDDSVQSGVQSDSVHTNSVQSGVQSDSVHTDSVQASDESVQPDVWVSDLQIPGSDQRRRGSARPSPAVDYGCTPMTENKQNTKVGKNTLIIIISREFRGVLTSPSRHNTLTLCWSNVGPAS